ncbi:hypothetical protein ACWESM_17690 [Nocardia sp. NPDC003999]
MVRPIASINVAAFERAEEAALVDALRDDPAWIDGLSIVSMLPDAHRSASCCWLAATWTPRPCSAWAHPCAVVWRRELRPAVGHRCVPAYGTGPVGVETLGWRSGRIAQAEFWLTERDLGIALCYNSGNPAITDRARSWSTGVMIVGAARDSLYGKTLAIIAIDSQCI